MSERFSQTTIEQALAGDFGRTLRFFEEVGSTNTEALAWAKQGAPEGALVVTDHQTRGRGRWGRSWSSAPGKLLQFSLVLRPKMRAERLGLISTALGVACADAVQELCGVQPTVKWPNDVRINGRKVAGILVETELSGTSVDIVIAGMGINVAWAAEEIPIELRDTTTSLAVEVGEAARPSRSALLAEVLKVFELRYRGLPAHADRLVAAATARSDVLGRDVTVALATDEIVRGTALRLSQAGELELQTSDGVRVLSVGEIARLR